MTLPRLITEVPGPASRAAVDTLARHECPAVTARRARRASALGTADDDPVVWAEAVDSQVVDVDGNRFVDLTSGFGVALVGHRHPDVVAAATRQAGTLIHAMGDAWPDASRIELLKRLAELAPGELSVSILGLSGSDAVDAAVKTAVLATGRTGVVTFAQGYHGLSLGVLALQGYNAAFTEPFSTITHPDVRQLPWGCSMEQLRASLQGVGLVMAEAIQGRGGIRTAPEGWLADVARTCREAGALFALDEIQTGIGRTGAWFAGPHEGVVPDLMCVGKALGGGFPISACMGTREVMDAWGASTGEALHTQTFLGHPVGCAAALATLDVLDKGGLEQVRERGAALEQAFTTAGYPMRGRGLMRAVRLPTEGLATCRALLRRGWIALPAGPLDLGLTPPMTLDDDQIHALTRDLADAIDEVR